MDCPNEIHAGEKETSCMLYLMEEAVKKDLMLQNDCIPDAPRDFLNYASLLKLSKTGVWGCPSYATKEKGAKLFPMMVDACVKYIEEALEAAQYDAW